MSPIARVSFAALLLACASVESSAQLKGAESAPVQLLIRGITDGVDPIPQLATIVDDPEPIGDVIVVSAVDEPDPLGLSLVVDEPDPFGTAILGALAPCKPLQSIVDLPDPIAVTITRGSLSGPTALPPGLWIHVGTIVDDPDPIGLMLIHLGITDGVDPIPNLLVTIERDGGSGQLKSITDLPDPISAHIRLTLTDGADPIPDLHTIVDDPDPLGSSLTIIEGPDPIPQLDHGLAPLQTIVDDPEPLGLVITVFQV